MVSEAPINNPKWPPPRKLKNAGRTPPLLQRGNIVLRGNKAPQLLLKSIPCLHVSKSNTCTALCETRCVRYKTYRRKACRGKQWELSSLHLAEGSGIFFSCRHNLSRCAHQNSFVSYRLVICLHSSSSSNPDQTVCTFIMQVCLSFATTYL